MYLERTERAEDSEAASGHQQPQWTTPAIRAQAEGEEQEQEDVPDAQMYGFLQPAQVRPVERTNRHASSRPQQFRETNQLKSQTEPTSHHVGDGVSMGL